MRALAAISLAYHAQSARAMPSPADIKACVLALELDAQASALHVLDPHSQLSHRACIELLREYACYGMNRIAFGQSPDAVAALADKAISGNYVVCAQRGGIYASGMLPYLLARQLGWPLVAQIHSLDNGRLMQYLPAGNRRSLPLPEQAVLVVHPQAALHANYAYARGRNCSINAIDLVQGRAKSGTRQAGAEMQPTQPEIHQEDAGKSTKTSTQAGAGTSTQTSTQAGAGSSTQTSAAATCTLQPRRSFHRRISIASNSRGIDRMRQAIEQSNAGGEVIQNGTADEHAARIIRLLKTKRLL